MLYQRCILLFFLMLGIIALNLLYNSSYQDNLDERYGGIEPYICSINSIDIENQDFSDLAFLDSIIGNKQIVFLGEQLHSDGATFQAKSRLIRYLHEKHNFNIVLYEASLFDMWFMDSLAKQQTGDVAKFNPAVGLYPFWWDNEDCRYLWEYYNKTLKSNNPITLGGFDVQLTGISQDKDARANSIKDFLLEKQINLEEYSSFNSVIKQLSNTYMWEYKHFSQTRFDSIQADLKNILNQLHEPVTEKDNIYYRYIKGVHDYGQLMWNYNPGEMPRMNARDLLMADNLIWQIDSLYNSQKIIIWSANLHLFNSPLANEGVMFTPLGKYIKDKYPETSYMMAFTSYALAKPNSQDLYSEAGVNSLEYLLHSKKHKYAYLEMSKINPDSFLKEDFFSIMNQRGSEKREWSNLVDGLFYIDIVSTINKTD